MKMPHTIINYRLRYALKCSMCIRMIHATYHKRFQDVSLVSSTVVTNTVLPGDGPVARGPILKCHMYKWKYSKRFLGYTLHYAQIIFPAQRNFIACAYHSGALARDFNGFSIMLKATACWATDVWGRWWLSR